MCVSEAGKGVAIMGDKTWKVYKPILGAPKQVIAVAFLALALPLAAQQPKAPLKGELSGKQIVEAQCFKCHQTGVGGAPKIGDRSAWILRVKQGLDSVTRAAIRGHGGMPARGGMAGITDEEMRKAVVYMLNYGTDSKK